MDQSLPTQGLQLRSRVKPTEDLELSLVAVDIAPPAADQVVVRIEATPINPSDLGLLLGPADVGTARVGGSTDRPIVTMTLPSAAMRSLAGRIDKSMPVGNEGAGLVVAAGDSPAAKGLLGKTVAIMGGAMYAQYRTVQAAACLVLPDNTTAVEGASCFVNPLTSLGMVETMRREGHTALVHTAAASNLGQMLNKVCLEDGVGLVNIVRSPEQAALLRGIGAVHVCNSTAPAFMADLVDALVATGATLAFDAIGGGKLASQILTAMEAAANGRPATPDTAQPSTSSYISMAFSTRGRPNCRATSA
jgi:NADPH:quinone reductase